MILTAVPVKVQAAEVEGTVQLSGPIPAPEIMAIESKKGNHSTEGCGSLKKASQKLLVDPMGGIRNAVVWLDLPRETPTSKAVLLDQKECVFSPHVVVVPPGTQVVIRNSDAVLHNIRIFEEGKPAMLMHKWQKPQGSDPWRFDAPGRYIVRCGVHPWMYAWVVVLSGTGSVTSPEGRFTIPNVPPGRYGLHVWHETLGTRQIPMTIGEGKEILNPIRMSRAKNSDEEISR